jgi:electron transfer flavoprotein beta subunit
VLHIICCVKQVPDPETPASQFKVDEAAKKVLPVPGIEPVPDEYAILGVEAALRIQEALGEAKITILCLGPEAAYDAVKKALAMGADEGVQLTDAAFDNGDSFATARALAAAIKKLEPFDLVLCGRQAPDWDVGVTPSIMADILGLPCVTRASKVEVSDGTLAVERVLSDGFETVETSLPAVVSVSNELGEPRYPQLRQIMAAAKKQVTRWTAGDLGVDASQVGAAGSLLSLDRLYVPVHEAQCEFIEGETMDEAAEKMAAKLREAKLI